MIKVENADDLEKAKILRQLLDVAQKAGGLQVSRQVLLIDQELITAAEAYEASQKGKLNGAHTLRSDQPVREQGVPDSPAIGGGAN